MKYIHKKTISSRIEEVEYEVVPCLKCCSEKITLDEYEDRYGYISTAKCTTCKNELQVHAGLVPLIKRWNETNDIPTVIKNLKSKRKQLKKKIKKLKDLHIRRSKL